MQQAWVKKKCIQNFRWNASRKETLERSKHKSGGSIQVDLRQIGWKGVEWIQLTQRRVQW